MESINNKTHDILKGSAKLCYLRMKSAWAGWMERQSLKLGRKGLIAAFVAFIMVYACGCVLLIAFGNGAHWENYALPQSPMESLKTAGEDKPGVPPSDAGIIKELKAFHAFMDSLALSPEGMALHDSILRARPGLKDSIKMAENLYLTKINDDEN